MPRKSSLVQASPDMVLGASASSVVITDTFDAVVAQWAAGVNNTGYQPVLPPSAMILGTGSGTPAKTDTALFAPATATTTPVGTATNPSPGVTEWTCPFLGTNQTAGSYTELGLVDASGNLFVHAMIDLTLTAGATTLVILDVTAD